MTVGERIKQVRESKGMSQDELAKRMGYKDRSSISKIEKSNDDNVYLDTIQTAADILNCSPLYLMGFAAVKPDNPDTDYFSNKYSQLEDSDKEIINKMIESLLSKQE